MKVKFKPIQDRLLVRQDSAGERATKGGIVIPEAAQEKMRQGTVVAAGDGVRSEGGALRPMAVKEGDRILFGHYTENVVVEGEEFLIMRETDALAVLLEG